VTWNPFLSLSNVWSEISGSRESICFDLLDDWTIHYAFKAVQPEVTAAYRRLFDRADVVTANGEGTVELARRFGRDDVVFLPNGCDPDRFDTANLANGQLTVGYVGKIGKRLDLKLIVDTVQRLRGVRFIFAGPILDPEYRSPLERLENLQLLGDVHYENVPALLQTFDIGWVPHRVGEGEVGGDVIKTYEYRAAGLPVLTTPVSGANSRGLDGVTVLPNADHAAWLLEATSNVSRVPRVTTSLPRDVEWRYKAQSILDALNAKSAAK
jgi:glycosyltransferase involved in cell wall biosynthesis